MSDNTRASGESAVQFGRVRIGPGQPVAVIAEIGVNHEGDADLCGTMIEAAARADADLVKLQIMDADANYAPGTASHELFSRAWLAPEKVAGLFRYAREIGVEVFATTGDAATLAWVDGLGPAGHKISSGLLTHLPFIGRVARTGRPLMISTGMAEDQEIDAAIDVAQASGARGIVLLHCTSIYPAPLETLHLAAIGRLAARYAVPTGFSDHSIGTEAATLATAAGATIIEKHFTLDADRTGFDHAISLEPDNFAKMVTSVRRATTARGSAIKTLSAAERVVAYASHRFLAAARDLAPDDRIAEEDIAFLRLPSDAPRGFLPSDFDRVLGRRVLRKISQRSAILSEDIDG